MSALQVERMKQKSTQLSERLKLCNNHWEDAFFITLARNFGFGVNGEAFEYWAKRVPLRAVDKHRDNLFQVEALFFGQAGILEDPAPAVYLSNYKESSIEYKIFCWCSAEAYWDVYFGLGENLRTAFAENGVEMTYNHLNVHIIEKA